MQNWRVTFFDYFRPNMLFNSQIAMRLQCARLYVKVIKVVQHVLEVQTLYAH